MSLDESANCSNGQNPQIGRRTIVILTALLFPGCATSPAPQSISASYVSSIPYQSWTCSQLHQEQSSLGAALASATAQQEQIRSGERVQSVVSMLIPIPPDTDSANITAQMDIAHLKGEQEAVRQALTYNSCPVESRIQTSVNDGSLAHQR